ncbi:MAG TPA: BMC domain-containing protein [Myxococcota bacterium]|nr:BMC domain-containing protein [Myxococcota bacterium]
MPLKTPMFKAPDLTIQPEAFAGLEVSGIPRGLVCLDALVKKAASRIVLANPVSPGKFLILIDGTVAEVEESLLEAERIAGDQLIDRFFLPFAHSQLEAGVFGLTNVKSDDSLGIVECATTCAGIRSCDAALKASEVQLLVIHLSAGIGGKCWYAFAGELYDVQASVLAATNAIDQGGKLLGTEVIPAPHPEFLESLGLG